jgi:hypothetical protein
VPNEAERIASWEVLVELTTRVPLIPSCRAWPSGGSAEWRNRGELGNRSRLGLGWPIGWDGGGRRSSDRAGDCLGS